MGFKARRTLHKLRRKRIRTRFKIKFKSKTRCNLLQTDTEQKERIWTRFDVDKDIKKTGWSIIHRNICCKKLQEKIQSSKVLLAGKIRCTDRQRQIISTLKEELKIHKAETVLKLKKADNALKIATLERDAVKLRCENLHDTIGHLTKKQSALQKENTMLRTRLQDIKIHFEEWNNISVKVSSVLNTPEESTYDVEKENETLKENLKTVEHDKQRLEHELSITLTKLLKFREECHGRSKRYCKETDDMETNTIAESCTNETNKSLAVGQYHDEDSRMFQYMGKDNTPKTLVEQSTNERYRNITSEKNIYQITASNVYMIDKSRVSGVGFSSSIQGSECNESLQVNEPLQV